MLGFFRKYQKIFFVFVTAIIVISFTFFGTSNAFTSKEDVPNRQIGKAIDGSKIMEREVAALAQIFREGERPHLLSDGWVNHLWLLTDFAEMLAKTYFDDLKEELQERIDKVRGFIPYVHPDADFLSSVSMWQQFAPEINQAIANIKAGPQEITKEQVSHLFALYRAQVAFPPHLLHQMLFYRQAQYSSLKPDPALPRFDLAIAGFHSVEDWFGLRFSSALSQAILSGAALAEKRGYVAGTPQARNELMLNVHRNLKEYAQGDNVPTMQEAAGYYQNAIRSLGMDEQSVTRLWTRVMLCRQLFQEVGDAAFVDSLSAKQFYKEARQSARVLSYEMQPQLKLNSFNDLLKFEIYLEAVSLKRNPLDIPSEWFSPEEVAQNHPQLVHKRYRVKMREVSESSLVSRASLKQTWDWQLDEENCLKVAQEFSLWGGKAFSSRNERFEAMEKLEPALRLKVDHFARMQIVKASPHLIDEALAKEPFKEEVIAISLSGKAAPFHNEVSSIEASKILDGEKQRLHFGGDYTYEVEVLERYSPEIVSFEQANRQGTLDKLLEGVLVAAFPQIAEKQGWVDFEEKRQELAACLYADVLQTLDGGKPFEQLDEYAKKRFAGHVEKGRGELVQGGQLPWGMKEQELTLKREDSDCKSAFELQEGQWSQVNEGRFFKLLSLSEGQMEEKDLQAIKEPLARQAQEKLMQELLEKIQACSGITFLSDE